MIDTLIVIGLAVLFLVLEISQRCARRKRERAWMAAAVEADEKRQRFHDRKVHAAWCAGTPQIRKKMEVKELERMFSLEREKKS